MLQKYVKIDLSLEELDFDQGLHRSCEQPIRVDAEMKQKDENHIDLVWKKRLFHQETQTQRLGENNIFKILPIIGSSETGR